MSLALVLGLALSVAGLALSAARRSYIEYFKSDVLERGRQGEWFNEEPHPLFTKVKAYDFVWRMPYKPDVQGYGQVEYFAKAHESIEKGAGDCDDKAILLADLWLGLGYEPVVVIGDTIAGGHAWVEMDGYVYDPTWDHWQVPVEEYYDRFGVAPEFWFTDKYWGVP